MDCSDFDCTYTSACGYDPYYYGYEVCGDGYDNDADGAADCDDYDDCCGTTECAYDHYYRYGTWMECR